MGETGPRSGARGGAGRRRALAALATAHIALVALVPLRDTRLGEGLAPVLDAYTVPLGLDATWDFFAFERAPRAVYHDWRALGADGAALAEGRWPEAAARERSAEGWLRRVAAARYLSRSDARAHAVLGPLLCAAVPGARRVELTQVATGVAPAADVAAGTRTVGDGLDALTRRAGEFTCPAEATP